MRIVGQTSIFNPIVLYDTSVPASNTGGFLKKLLDPVVQVQADDGTVLYKSGDFYEATGQYYLMGFATMLAIGVGYLYLRSK